MRTLEEKKLLVNAICEYMPYEPCIANEDIDSGYPIRIHIGDLRLPNYVDGYTLDSQIYGECKADKTVIYLRPMESITDEEKEFICNKCCIQAVSLIGGNSGSIMPMLAVEWLIDWYRENLIDYRGLIKKGIAKPIGTEKKFEG